MKVIKYLTILLLIFLCQDSFAQITIDGTVTDADLNPVSDALVEIIDEDDSTNVYSSNTNEQGYFSISAITGIETKLSQTLQDYLVLSNYPNPFNPTTVIYFELPKADNIEITIYDILGREVRTLYNSFHEAGSDQIIWDGRNNRNSPVAAGIYLCRLKTKDMFKVHKMVLLDGGSSSFLVSNTRTLKFHFQKTSSIKSIFNFTLRVTGNDILETEFRYLTCSKDTTVNLMVPSTLQSVSIGPEGGKLETKDFILFVPEGAFTELSNVRLSIDPNDNSFIETSASPLFLIDGIPDKYSKNLLIGIKPDNPTAETLYSAIGKTGYNWGNGDEEYFFNFEPTFDSLGKYYIEIIPESLESSTSSYIMSKTSNYIPRSNISLKLINGYYYYDDVSFIYFYPAKYQNEILAFKSLISEVIKIFLDVGFTNEKIITWGILSPVEVVIRYLPNYSLKPLRYASMVEHNLIQINDEYFTAENFSEIRREFGHLYYYRYFFNQIFDKQKTYELGGKKWLSNDPNLRVLHHAIATWIEEVFEPIEENYIPYCFKGNEMEIFKGFASGIDFNLITTNECKHGYGLAAVVKYLINEYGTNLLFTFYNNLFEKSGIDGFLDAVRESPTQISNQKLSENIWFPNFFKEYISGNIYNVQGEKFLDNITKTIEFNDGDTLKYIDETYNDLSAKLFRININSKDIKDNKSLNFKLGPSSLNLDYVKTLVFGISGNNLTFLSEGIDFSVGSLSKYDGLLACVVNSGNEPPYTGTSNINLDIRVKDELPFNNCTISLRLNGIFEQHSTYTNPSVDTTYSWSAKWYTKGNFTGYVYEGIINTELQGGGKGTIKFTVDDNLNIVSFDVQATDDDGTNKSEWSCSGANISPTYQITDYVEYKIYHQNTCNYLTDVYAYYEDPNWNSKMTGYFCDDNSSLEIVLSKF